MKDTDSRFTGKVMLDRMEQREASLEENLRRQEVLRAELKILVGLAAADRAYLRELSGRTGKPRDRRLAGRQSIRACVSELLEGSEGMTALEIIDALKTTFDRDVARTTLSSILSKMKNHTRLLLDDGRWRLAPKIK